MAFANIAAGTTDGVVVAAVAGKKIRVLAVVMVCGGTATTVVFQSNATAVSATFAQGINGVTTLSYAPGGWFETAEGEALKATTGAGSTTGIQVVYTLVG